jgi:hypothetical protein
MELRALGYMDGFEHSEPEMADNEEYMEGYAQGVIDASNLMVPGDVKWEPLDILFNEVATEI